MKLNISCPLTGQQKAIAIDDEKKLSIFYGRRMGQEIEGDNLGDEFKGYIFKITGGNDKDGFSMKQGVLVQGRVRLLMGKGQTCYRPRRAGERKRKSVRGCIVGPDLSVIALAIVKTGEQQIAGLTDNKLPKRLGPKRATKIRKLFALKKEDDVRRFVIRRKIEKEGKPIRYKAPKIQRLVTDARLRRKRQYKADKKARWETTRKAVADYSKVLEAYKKKKAEAAREQAAHKKEEKAQKYQKKEETAPVKADPKKAGVKPTGAAAKTTDKKVEAPKKGAQPTTQATKTQDKKAAAPAPTKAATTDKKAAAPAPTKAADTKAPQGKAPQGKATTKK